MGQIRLYRKFYCINIVKTSSTTDENYVLFDPYFLSGNTFVAGTGDTESSDLIESNLEVVQFSTGIYYTNLNPNLYASDVTYDLVWYVNYLDIAPLKKLSTRFRINVNKFTNEIEIDFLGAPLEFEIYQSPTELDISQSPTEIEFPGQSLGIDISQSPPEIDIS
jgi:hypothetical protein